MKIEGKLRWRHSHGRWYLEDDKHGWGHIDHNCFGWLASAPQANHRFNTCKAAKIWTERKVKEHVKPKQKSPSKRPNESESSEK